MLPRLRHALSFLAFLLLAATTVAQPESPPSTAPAPGPLWYGAGFNFGFTTSSNINLIQIGISPMAGFRIFAPFSVGPRLAVYYNYFKGRTQSGRTDSAQPLSLGAGGFLRYKVFPYVFVHLEYQFESQALVYADVDELRVVRNERHNLFVGGGYSSSEGPGSLGLEMLLLLNTNQTSPNTVDLPLEMRFAVTYGF